MISDSKNCDQIKESNFVILQNLLFPDERTCSDEDMYFHKKDKTVMFNTYFNVFSSEKWFLYTRLSSVSLRLEAIGNFRIQIYSNNILILEGNYSLPQKGQLAIDIPCCKNCGLISFAFTPESEDAHLFSGAYITNDEDLIRDIHMAIDICTFKREQYLRRNIEILKKAI